jgi:hypothetical protein
MNDNLKEIEKQKIGRKQHELHLLKTLSDDLWEVIGILGHEASSTADLLLGHLADLTIRKLEVDHELESV